MLKLSTATPRLIRVISEPPVERQVFDDGNIEIENEDDQDPRQEGNAQAEKVVRQQQERQD